MLSEVELSRLSFKLDGDFADAGKLRALALDVFDRLYIVAYERYEHRDLLLRVHLEEGSLKGLVVTGVRPEDAHSIVSRYSSFEEAIADLARDGEIVSEGVLRESPLNEVVKNSVRPKIRKSGGAFSSIGEIIEEVKHRKKTRERGEEETITLLGGEDAVPPNIRQAVNVLFAKLRTVGEQVEIPVDQLVRAEEPSRKRIHRTAEQRRRWVVDIISRERNGTPEINVRKV